MGRIFETIKELKEYEYKLGKDELEYLYFSDNLPVVEQLELTEGLTNKIVDIYKNKSSNENVADLKLEFEDSPLIYYMNPLINKINTLVREGIIEKNWVEQLTNYLIYYGESPWEVKLGLILSSRYLEERKLSEVFDVFSKSGEYIFYLMNTIRNLNKYNNYLVELSKRSKGTIKVFAITNLEYFSSDIISYLIEDGYKDEIYENLLLNYIFTTINIDRYLEKYINKCQLDNLSYIICSYLRKNEFSIIKNKNKFIESYLSLISRMGNNYENLNSIYLIRENTIADETIDSNTKELENKLNILLEDEKWSIILENAIKEGIGLSEEIIALADFYDYKLEFKDLLPYLKRDYKDINAYYYLIEEGNKADKMKLLSFFESHYNIDELCKVPKDVEDEELKEEDLDYVIFALIVKSLREIYPNGKNIAIKAINGQINKIRNESIKYIRRYRDELTDVELEIIKKAYGSEPNYKIKLEMEKLICDCNDGKKEYIDIADLVNYEHVSDIYLLNTEVTGCQFRHSGNLEEELENSKIFNLKLEENNYYDNKLIKVAGENGFVIGTISKKDNHLLSNLLKGGKYLYGKIEKYNLEDSSIDMRVYLSYKDVIESINDTILMLHGSNTGEFLN